MQIPVEIFLVYSAVLIVCSAAAGWLTGREKGYGEGWHDAGERQRKKSADELFAEFQRHRFTGRPW